VYDPTYASFAYRPAGGGADVIVAFGSSGLGRSLPAAAPAGAISAEIRAISGGPSGGVSAASVAVTKAATVPSGPSVRASLASARRPGLSLVAQGSGDGLIRSA